MEFKIVICDDDAEFLEELQRRTREIVEENESECSIITLNSGGDLAEYCKNNDVDIVLTDIDMPNMPDINSNDAPNQNGFEAAKMLQASNPNTEIVFVSAHEEFAYQSFFYKPFTFISKRDMERLDGELTELIEKIKLRKMFGMPACLVCDKRSYVIKVNEIIYFKSGGHYIYSYTVSGRDKTYRCNIKNAYEQLESAGFIYIHRSYLINCRYIDCFDTQTVTLRNGEKFNVTRDKDKLYEAQRVFGRYKRSFR